MNKAKKIGGFFLSICLLLMLFSGEAFAASAKVSVSSVNGNVGSTVKVTCSATTSGVAIGGADITLKYDPAALSVVSCSSGASGSSGSVYYSGYATSGGLNKLSFTVSFKILKAGTHSISVTSADVYDYEAAGSVSTSSSGGKVTGKVPSTNNGTTNNNNNNNNNNNSNTNNRPQNSKDTNNKLSALRVYPGTLSPAFQTDISEYTVTVPAGTKDVTISATAASSKASVSVSGGKDLKPGPNEAKVIVVAESGASKAYILTIMCGEEEKIQIGGIEYTINENFSDEQIPTGFSRKQVAYKDRQYEAVVNAKGSLVLLNLKAGEKESFYIYNQETQDVQNFVQIVLSEGKYIIPLALNENVKEFADSRVVTLQVQDKDFEAWKLDEEFCVVYAMNQNEEYVLYRYDKVDKTFQRYVEVQAEEVEQEIKSEEKTLFPNEYYMYAIIALGVLCFILFIAMIYFIASRKARHEGRKRKAIKRQEKQRAKEEKERAKQQAKEDKRLAKQKKKEK